MKIKGVLWHSTGGNNTALSRYVQPSKSNKKYDKLISLIGENKYKNSWNQIKLYAGVNAFIGKLADGTVTTIQTLPWQLRPWGCGKGPKGTCNDGWVQFEICEDNLKDTKYFNQVYKEACELTAYLCKKYNLNPHGTVTHNGVKIPVILCHADSYKLKMGTNHGDVLYWFAKHGKTMQDVRDDVATLLNGSTLPYKVKVNVNKLNIRKGPSTKYSIAGQITDRGVYTITEVKNNYGKLLSGAGWVYLKGYTTKYKG